LRNSRKCFKCKSKGKILQQKHPEKKSGPGETHLEWWHRAKERRTGEYHQKQGGPQCQVPEKGKRRRRSRMPMGCGNYKVIFNKQVGQNTLPKLYLSPFSK
jgi:hypothetical protein